MLHVVRRLAKLQPISLIPTYLAAHTVPREFQGRPDAYLDAMLDPALLGRIQSEQLAEFADVFCERTAFDVAQARRFLATCKQYGMTPRVHADQISQCGASKLASELGASSADHLEHIDHAGIAAMKEAGTIAVLLPGCSFFLGVEHAPARRILDADIPVALATDFNPGSSPIESMPLILSMACTQMGMTPTEAIVAATANAAAVLKRQDQIGAFLPGMQADLLVLDVPNHRQWLYHVGRNCVRWVIKGGRIVVDRSSR
jgi:imidazolonepropionase